jgi:hypothetical protein
VTTDHTCPVEWAADHGLLEGSPVDRSWCLSHQMDTMMTLEPINAMAPELLLWQQGALSVFYAPWDWVNTSAKVMLVGITPGLHQATAALTEARRSLADGLSPEEALRRADAVGSFSGPMRTNLVTMLDGIGLADALGIESTAQLFDDMHHLAAHVSAIDYPVLVHGRNYSGASPPLVGHPVLTSMVRACLGARVALRPTRSSCPWEKPPRPPWTSWHARTSWTADGACSVSPTLPGPTGIGSACTPSGVPSWPSRSSNGAPGSSELLVGPS